MNQESASDLIKIYPNPANEILNILFDTDIRNKDIEIRITDMKGATLISTGFFQAADNKAKIPIHLPNGLYTLYVNFLDSNISPVSKSFIVFNHLSY